jgi:hypothetical protein
VIAKRTNAVNDRIGLEPDPSGIVVDPTPLADLRVLIHPMVSASAIGLHREVPHGEHGSFSY